MIPDRLYFKIGDVARICGVETYVLRFWETQFPQLKPNKSGTGQRLYRRRDVELALEIKRLVHGEGYTLAGARQTLESGGKRREPKQSVATAEPTESQRGTEAAATGATLSRQKLEQIRSELREISSLLSSREPMAAGPQPVMRRERPKIVRPRSDSDSLFPF